GRPDRVVLRRQVVPPEVDDPVRHPASLGFPDERPLADEEPRARRDEHRWSLAVEELGVARARDAPGEAEPGLPWDRQPAERGPEGREDMATATGPQCQQRRTIPLKAHRAQAAVVEKALGEDRLDDPVHARRLPRLE